MLRKRYTADVDGFRKLLRRLIEERGIDLTELARRTGLSRVTVSRTLNGHTLPHYATRRLFAEAFSIEPEAFERMWREIEAGAKPSDDYVEIYGPRLTEIRKLLGFPPERVGPALGMSADDVTELEEGGMSFVAVEAIDRLATVLKMSRGELLERLAVPDEFFERPKKFPDMPIGLNLRMRRPAQIVPEFQIGIAASRRVEKIAEHPDAHRPIHSLDRRAFTVVVDGDCMTPKWKNGEIVVFSFDAVEREGLIPGRSYYLQFADGTSTFKRVFLDENDPEIRVLRCWNVKKYPQEWKVHVDEVVRIARAISKVVVPDEREDAELAEIAGAKGSKPRRRRR